MDTFWVFLIGQGSMVVMIAGCLWIAFKTISYKDEIIIKRKESAEKEDNMMVKIPSKPGGVVRPKTEEEKMRDKDEGYQAFKELLEER